MRVDDNVGDFLSIRVQKSQATAACFPLPQLLCPSVTDDHILASGVTTDIVGVVRELHRGEKRKRGAIEDLRDSIQGARYKKAIGGGVVKDALWFSQVRDRVNSLARLQIDDFESVVVHGSTKRRWPFVSTLR